MAALAPSMERYGITRGYSSGIGFTLAMAASLGSLANLATATDKAKTASGSSTSRNVARTPAVDVHQFIYRPPPGRTQCPLRPAERDDGVRRDVIGQFQQSAEPVRDKRGHRGERRAQAFGAGGQQQVLHTRPDRRLH